jgi:hypothetical protein
MHKIDNEVAWPAAVARVVNRLCGANNAQMTTIRTVLKSGAACSRIPAIQLHHQ